MVCTGNICRSPTAEGFLRARADERGLGHLVDVDGCGTDAYHVGEPPDRRAIAHAARRGVDLSDLRARRLRQADLQSFDLLLAMDRGHLNALHRMAVPGQESKLRLYLEFAPGAGRTELPDPWYGGTADFELVIDLVEQATEGILQALTAGRLP